MLSRRFEVSNKVWVKGREKERERGPKEKEKEKEKSWLRWQREAEGG